MGSPDSEDYQLEIMDNAVGLLKVRQESKTKSRAKSWIRDVAADHAALVERQKHSESAPIKRLKELKQLLRSIANDAQHLRSDIDRVWPYLHDVVFAYSNSEDWKREDGQVAFKERLVDLPYRLGCDLDELAETLKRIDSRIRKDTGGELPLARIRRAHPDHVLAVECWELFDYWRPEEASGTTEGPYHEFVGLVYEIATGLEPHTGLERWVKMTVVRCGRAQIFVPSASGWLRFWPEGTSPVGYLSRSSLAEQIFDTPDALQQSIKIDGG